MKLTQQNAQEELLNLRLDQGLTQDRLSNLTGVSRATIINIEKGNSKPGATTLFNLNKYIKTLPEDAKI